MSFMKIGMFAVALSVFAFAACGGDDGTDATPKAAGGKGGTTAAGGTGSGGSTSVPTECVGKETWSAGVEYTFEDEAIQTGELYTCLDKGTKCASVKPGTDATVWEKMDIQCADTDTDGGDGGTTASGGTTGSGGQTSSGGDTGTAGDTGSAGNTGSAGAGM